MITIVISGIMIIIEVINILIIIIIKYITDPNQE